MNRRLTHQLEAQSEGSFLLAMNRRLRFRLVVVQESFASRRWHTNPKRKRGPCLRNLSPRLRFGLVSIIMTFVTIH